MICSGISDTFGFRGYCSFRGAMSSEYDYSKGFGVPSCYVNHAMIGTRARELEPGVTE